MWPPGFGLSSAGSGSLVTEEHPLTVPFARCSARGVLLSGDLLAVVEEDIFLDHIVAGATFAPVENLLMIDMVASETLGLAPTIDVHSKQERGAGKEEVARHR